LMKTFDEIYILDLHGNSLKKETTPEGGKDENVFDIRQGVAIALFIKNKDKKESVIYHTNLYGLREEKYDWLDKNAFKKENYSLVKPQSPYYFLKKYDTNAIRRYLDWKNINEIFPVNVTGIVTARDKFVIGFNKDELRNRILQFKNLYLSDEIIKEAFNLKDTRGWKLSLARKKLLEDEKWDTYYQKILYRPFDTRYIYYTESMVDWGRPEIMRHMLEENIGLITARSNKSSNMDHFYITDLMMETKCGERTTQSAIFPLYLYPDEQKKNLFNHTKTEKEPNISPIIFKKLEEIYKRIPTPEEILYYIYGIFYSNIYRKTYAEFLKIDFPRVPFTADESLFCKIGNLGKELTDLHLLKSFLLDIPVARYQGSGDNDRIEKIDYQENEQRIYINSEKYFEGVAPEVWNYHIGGYQVLPKYLKDRKGKIMEDAPHYCRIVTALQKTIEIQKQIDNLYPEIEKDLVEF
jgi:predicted helicase